MHFQVTLDRDENGATGDGCLLHQLERQPAAHAQHVPAQRQQLRAERPADDLVECVVASDVLAYAEQLAAACGARASAAQKLETEI